MSKLPSGSHRGQPKWDRDHVRPRTSPGPTSDELEARLAEVVGPATYAVAEQYRRSGLRWRVLMLPVLVALLVALIWRQVPSVQGLARLLARDHLLWAPPRQVSQQALSQRLRCLPAELFDAVLHETLPALAARAAGRVRPHPLAVARVRPSIRPGVRRPARQAPARPQRPLDRRLQRHRHAGLGHLAPVRRPRRPRRRCR